MGGDLCSPWLKATTGVVVNNNNNHFGANSSPSPHDYVLTEINPPQTPNVWNRPVPPIPTDEQHHVGRDPRRPRSSSPQQFLGSDYQNSSVLLKLDLERGAAAASAAQDPRLKRLSIEIDEDVPQAPPRITSLQSPAVQPLRLPPPGSNSPGLVTAQEACLGSYLETWGLFRAQNVCYPRYRLKTI